MSQETQAAPKSWKGEDSTSALEPQKECSPADTLILPNDTSLGLMTSTTI